MRIIIFLSLLLTVNSCWFSSKSGAVKKIEQFTIRKGKNPEKGLNKNDLTNIINDLPSGIMWAVNKIGGIENILSHCDQNKDDTVTISEVRNMDTCISKCWMSTAIQTFL